jgi:hypothetical protein
VLVLDGKKFSDQKTQDSINVYLKKLGAMFWDGCSMTFLQDKFYGMLFVAASPSVATRKLRSVFDSTLSYVVLHMPPWSLEELEGVGKNSRCGA